VKISDAIEQLEHFKKTHGDLSLMIMGDIAGCKTTMMVDCIEFYHDMTSKNMKAVFVRAEGLDHMLRDCKLGDE
jgi:hypothetical protein